MKDGGLTALTTCAARLRNSLLYLPASFRPFSSAE
jgi:hypothetical protein